MMRILLLILIVLLAEATLANPRAGVEYRYVAWIGNETLSIAEPKDDSSEGWMKVSNDASWRAEFCDVASDYVCFSSPLHAFAVPKHFDPAVRMWTVRGVKFEVVDENVTVSIFGRRFDDLFVIKTPLEATLLGRETGSPGYSLFSPRHGLVGFLLDRKLRTYWMEGTTGFGASQTEVSPTNTTRD